MAMNISVTVENFESVALPHLNDLYRAARRIIGDQAEAEDAVQETYYQAWKSFHRFETGTNCRAWLFKILFHVINHQRRKLWRWSLFATIEEAPCAIPTYEPPIPQDLTDEDVLRAFEKLPQHYREVVQLADVQEFSYKEIADMLDIPMGTVMSRLSRGRKLLRAELAEVAEGYGIHNIEEIAPALVM